MLACSVLNWLFKNSEGDATEVAIKGICLVTHSGTIKECAVSGMGLALFTLGGVSVAALKFKKRLDK